MCTTRSAYDEASRRVEQILAAVFIEQLLAFPCFFSGVITLASAHELFHLMSASNDKRNANGANLVTMA